jgi:ethanolamine utilization protein EutN
LFIAKVIGTVVSTIKHPAYLGHKILVVQPMHLPGASEEEIVLAIDDAHAGVGDTVLLMREGSSARLILGAPLAPIPIISVVVGVIDSLDLMAEPIE